MEITIEQVIQYHDTNQTSQPEPRLLVQDGIWVIWYLNQNGSYIEIGRERI